MLLRTQILGRYFGPGQDPPSGRDFRAVRRGAQSRGIAVGMATRPDQLEGPLGQIRHGLLHHGRCHRDDDLALLKRV